MLTAAQLRLIVSASIPTFDASCRDSDSDDPRSHTMNTPERDPSAGPGSKDGNHCYSWKKGQGGGGGSTVGSGKFCPQMSKVKPVGPGKFSAPLKNGDFKQGDIQVGDQFLSMVWKGFTYTIANSSAVTTRDVGVHAGGYMAVAEMDGVGGHVYQNLHVVPRNGRLIASNADAFHSADMDHAPTFSNVHFKSMLDDYMNCETTKHDLNLTSSRPQSNF
eukprot:SAG31_NODE_127_length_23612_cov_39.709863_2_plen_218_part_00